LQHSPGCKACSNLVPQFSSCNLLLQSPPAIVSPLSFHQSLHLEMNAAKAYADKTSNKAFVLDLLWIHKILKVFPFCPHFMMVVKRELNVEPKEGCVLA
ncbi:hypothetical protein LINPERHAP2_LOCUS14779, partial [Linum perenne]